MIKLYNKYKEVIMYLIFGVLTTLVSIITYFVLTKTIFNPNNEIQLQVANIISWIVSVTFAYITNRKYVFESNSKDNKQLKEIYSFYSSRIITLLVEMAIMGVGVSIMHFNDFIVKIVAQVIVIVSNYVFSKLFVFKQIDNVK